MYGRRSAGGQNASDASVLDEGSTIHVDSPSLVLAFRRTPRDDAQTPALQAVRPLTK
jgi:hypothetical protein